MNSKLRDTFASAIVAIYVLPIAWWALSSMLTNDVLLNPGRVLSLDFTLTPINYIVVLMGDIGGIFNSRQSLLSSVIVATVSTLIVLLAALPMAHALSVLQPRYSRMLVMLLLLQRLLPPIVLVFPLLLAYHATNLLDTHLGVALAHSAINLPFAVLMLKSYCDEIPREVLDAAMLDGATTWQSFRRIVVPQLGNAVTATAILAFTLSWTEFLLSLFLTQNLRLVPVQAGILVMNMWGLISALTTAALIPAFILILLAQRHLVRGLTLGLAK